MGTAAGLGFIVLVDDEVACSEWEQELYRMGVPPEMDVYFHTVEEAAGEARDVPARRAARRSCSPATSRR